jgi:multisubunit Na+/H+ antiporter MnhE subunit
VLVTAAPGTVVVDVDEESGDMRVHDLAAGAPAVERVVQR